MASLPALQASRSQLVDQIASLTAVIKVNQQNLQKLEGSLPFAPAAQRTQIQGNISTLKAQIAQDTAELQRLTRELADLDAQIAQAREQAGPRESAGQTVSQAQKANDDRADVVSPAAAAPPLGGLTQTNADTFQPNPTVGTDGTSVPITTSQSLPPTTASPGAARQTIAPPNYPGQITVDPFGGYPSDDQYRPTTNAGAGAASDDATGGAGVRAALNNLFAGDITPSPNVLDQYASYTYSISIYLMSAADYATLINNPLVLPKGAQLILQSGGAPIAGGTLPTVSSASDAEGQAGGFYGDTAATVLPDLGRNPNFSLDYYLDDLRVTSVITGKGTGISHNVTQLKFKVIEPTGITFLDNLYKATDQYVKLSGTPQVNYAAQTYLMVIRFYGYDKDGNLVFTQKQPFTDPVSNKRIETTVEKFIPFRFTAIKFRVANKLVEYDCEAVCPQNDVATAPARGTIPYNVELTSQNLKDLLQGKETFSAGGEGRQAAAQTDTRLSAKSSIPAVGTDTEFENRLYGAGTSAGTFGTNAELEQSLGRNIAVVAAGTSATSAPPKASASTSKTLITGLADALNRASQEWVDKGTYEFADRYFIEMDPIIAQAKVVPPGSTNLSFVPMSPNDTAREKALPGTQSVDNNARRFSILAGTSVVQFLDQVVRNSSYIYDQQIKYYDPKPPHELITNGVPANITGWYRISMQAVPQGASRYDRKRNDYAYDITYKIEIYAINDAKSDFFPGARYRGSHKRYDYWFTGQNTQILDYQQDFNYLYYIVQNSKAPVRTRTTNWREVPKFSAQPRSGQSDQMNTGPVSEPGAQLADYLYSPGDTAKIKLRILGDPAWIQQGDVRGGLPRGRSLYGAFLPDGTINYGGQEILFEVLWNKPADYDLSTGLMDPGTKNYDANRRAGIAGDAVQTYVYRANICTSTFSRGRFEQELEGSQIYFELPQAKQQAAEKQEKTAQAKATNYRNPLTNVPQASPGLHELDTGSGGEVNYKPTSLAAIKDSQRPKSNLTAAPLAGSSLGAEGFGDEALGLSQTTAPTSSTQVVGPASSGSAATQTLGGASGRDAGSPPTVNLYLNNGQTVQVTNQGQINAYRQGGFADPQAASAATARLNTATQAANSPTTAAPKQKIARET